MKPAKATKPFRQMWGQPILIAVLTAIGLIAALLGDGFWDWLSTLTLAVPVLAACWFACVPQGRK